MTKEEEKAYKYYKRINEDDLKNIDTFGEPTRTRIKYMQTLLDQIQNQEKEIEELKDITRAYDGMAGTMPEGHPIIIADKEYFDSGRFIQRYISKDVIEKKIEELEDLLDLAENDTRVAKYKISALKEEIEDFKDLLR